MDIYGRPRNGGGYAGVQCKGKRRWPPTTLTTDEIDAEVAQALAFKPALTEFIFATTASDDAAVQAHVRAITERHRKEGLFSVHVFGWGDVRDQIICRRSHPSCTQSLMDKKTTPSNNLNIVRGVGGGYPHHRPGAWLDRLADHLDLSPKTFYRWRRRWREVFAQNQTWRDLSRRKW